jgi:hypothetical protein|tara:strand:- start:3906 stop:4112 length:207 start_codon:yes stop_codon:yes gene_type:complete
MNKIKEALELKYKYEIKKYKVDINNYFTSSVGVADHPSIVDTVDGLIEQLAAAEEKLATLEILNEPNE